MITLRDILELINFRRIESELERSYQENSNTIRIYLDFKDWFEFGIYDFAYEGEREDRVGKILTKELLDSEVTSIHSIDGLNLIAIWINTEKSVDN